MSAVARCAVAAAALSLVFAGVATTPAFAHGPSRQKVVEKIEIVAPADKVWGIVGNFQDMSWLPSVVNTEGTGGNEVGAKRQLTLKSGGVIEESLSKYDAGAKSLSYRIDSVDVKVLPVSNYTSTISVKNAGGKTEVEWKGAFYRGYMNNDPPPELSDEAAVKAVTDVYASGLAALKAKAEGK